MRHFGFEICTNFSEGLAFSFGKLGLRKNVSVSVSKNLDSEKNLGLSDFGLKKVSVLVSEFLV